MMLRQGDVTVETDDDIHSIHLNFHTEHSYDRGWPEDWADEVSPVGDFPTLTPAAGIERLRRSRAAAEAHVGEWRHDDTLDLRQWQQPMESAGYVAHREQFV